jgi:hypothetical protein
MTTTARLISLHGGSFKPAPRVGYGVLLSLICLGGQGLGIRENHAPPLPTEPTKAQPGIMATVRRSGSHANPFPVLFY